MKLKTPRNLLLAAALFPALPVAATPEVNTMTPKVTGQFQIIDEIAEAGVESRVVGKLQSVRLNGQSLLALVAEATETEFPRGARLLVDLGGIKASAAPRGGVVGASVWVVNRDGDVLANATPFIIFEFDFDALIFSGFFDISTGQEKTKNHFPATMRLLFPEREIDVLFVGNCFEHFRATAANDEGVQRVRGNTKFRGEGSGIFDGSPFVGTAVVGLRGNELVELD